MNGSKEYEDQYRKPLHEELVVEEINVFCGHGERKWMDEFVH
jgi:hypothetical protein